MSRILGICGCVRAPTESRTWQALQLALAGAKRAGAEVDIIQLHSFKLPFFDGRMTCDDPPSEVALLLQRVRAADGLILSSPVYHGTISGVLKNCIDFFQWLANDDPPFLSNKMLGLLCVSGGMANTAALDPFYHIARALNAWVLPLTVVAPGSAFNEQRQIVDQDLKIRLVMLGQRLATSTQMLGPTKIEKEGGASPLDLKAGFSAPQQR